MIGPAHEQRPSRWRRLGRCYPLLLEIAPLLLLALTVYLVISSYSTLPASIPTHFDVRGRVDGWGGKGTLILLPAVSFSGYVMMTAVSAAISLAEDPKSLINLPDKRKAAITQARAEELRVLLGRGLLAMKTLTAGLAAYGVYSTVEVARGEAEAMGPWLYVLLGALILCAAAMVWRSLSLALSGQG